MTTFDEDRFEDKYEHYFTELQQAYRAAFESMSERHDSGLVHAVDQQVLAESEPFYEADGKFRIELPDDAVERIEDDVALSGTELETVFEEYADEIERHLREVFDLQST